MATQLSATQINEYRENGFVIIKEFCSEQKTNLLYKNALKDQPRRNFKHYSGVRLRPYMPAFPYTGMPVAIQWEINVYMMRLLKKRYEKFIV